MEEIKNLKIKVSLWRLLRLIAAATDESQHAVLARLLTREWECLERVRRTKES